MTTEAQSVPSAGAPERAASRAAAWTAYGIGLVAALALGHFVLGLPIQVSDSFGNMQELSKSWSELLGDQFQKRNFLRPFLWAELKLVYDLSGGSYTTWFRTTHAVQVAVLALLFIALLRARTWHDVACVPFALAVLIGMHTFTGTVREAFPINTFMTLLILCFAAALLSLNRYRWWNDVLVAVLFVVASLTVETGLLVWVIAVGAALLGANGVSRRGLAALTLLLAGYFVARFAVLDVGSPDLLERASGFGFRVLEPEELVARFGDNPLPFYAYNVVSSMLSVLLSEPRGGVYTLTRSIAAGELQPAMIVALGASAGALLLLARFAWIRRDDWRLRRFTHDDRLVLLFGMVLAANAVMSYPYMKDTNMTPAGAFLAPAVFAAARSLLHRNDLTGPVPIPAWTVIAALIVSSAWSLRALDLHATLRQAAVTERLDWAYIESDVAAGRVDVSSAEERALLESLRHDALIAHPAPADLRLPFPGLSSP